MNAKTLEEYEQITQLLQSGQIPGHKGDSGQGKPQAQNGQYCDDIIYSLCKSVLEKGL